MKIRPVGAELSRADRRTDMTKRIAAVRNAPKNSPASFALVFRSVRETSKSVARNFIPILGGFYNKTCALYIPMAANFSYQ